MPCTGPLHFSHSDDYVYDCYPIPAPDAGTSVLVCDVEHTSFHLGMCGRKFVLGLFGESPCIWSPDLMTGSMQELYRQMARLLLKISQVWRMPPSLPWFFVVSLCHLCEDNTTPDEVLTS